jgi:hypothetical protein
MKPSHNATAGHSRKTIANTPVCHHKTRPTCQKTSQYLQSIDICNSLIISEMTFIVIDTPKTLEIAVTR